MNHLIKGYYNGYQYVEEGNLSTYSIRSGFNFYCYQYDRLKNAIVENDYCNALEETINVLETSDMVQYVSLWNEDLILDEAIKKKKFIAKRFWL